MCVITEITAQLTGNLYAAIRRKMTLLCSSGIVSHEGLLTAFINGTSFVIIHSFSRFYGAEGDMAEVNLNKSLSILSDNRFLKIFVSIFIDLMPLKFYLPPEEIIYFDALRRVELLGEEIIERRGRGELISTHQRRTKRELAFSKTLPLVTISVLP